MKNVKFQVFLLVISFYIRIIFRIFALKIFIKWDIRKKEAERKREGLKKEDSETKGVCWIKASISHFNNQQRHTT